MTAAEVRAALERHYAGREWLLLFEVRASSGADAGAQADALALNLWPSKGLELHGFEIKVSRGDWLRELREPLKCAPVKRFCDRWWLLAPPGVLGQLSELPEGWGAGEVLDDGTIRVVVPAPQLLASPWPRGFVASMLRRAKVPS